MAELVLKKMALAELSESYARVKRDLHRCCSSKHSGTATEMQSVSRPSPKSASARVEAICSVKKSADTCRPCKGTCRPYSRGYRLS